MVARHVIFTPDKSVAVRHNLEDTVGFLSAVQVGRKAARFIGADFLGTFRSVRFFRFHRLLIYCRLFSLVLLFFLCLFFVTTVVVFDNSSNSSLLFSTLLVLIRFFAFIHRCFRRALHAFRTTSFFAVRHINHPSFFEPRHHPVQIRRPEHLPFFVEHKKVELTENPLQHTGIQIIHSCESPHTKRTTGRFIIVRFAQMRKKHHIDSERLRSVKFHHHPDNIVITQKIYL